MMVSPEDYPQFNEPKVGEMWEHPLHGRYLVRKREPTTIFVTFLDKPFLRTIAGQETAYMGAPGGLSPSSFRRTHRKLS